MIEIPVAMAATYRSEHDQRTASEYDLQIQLTGHLPFRLQSFALLQLCYIVLVIQRDQMKKFLKTALQCAIFTLIASQTTAQTKEGLVRPAKVFTISAAPSNLQRTYPAIVLPSREVQLTFRVSGRVVELPVRGAM